MDRLDDIVRGRILHALTMKLGLQIYDSIYTQTAFTFWDSLVRNMELERAPVFDQLCEDLFFEVNSDDE
jgi:hypothetical protein